MALCGVDSAGWRYNIAGVVGWRLHIGTIEGALLCDEALDAL